MLKKIMLACITSALLLVSAVVHAGLSAAVTAKPITVVFSCKLNDGFTKEDAMEVNARWLQWARATGGSNEITSSYLTPLVGDFDGFMWVDTYPNIATWGKVTDDVSGSAFDAEFDKVATCSGNRIYRGEETIPALTR